ncbi:MAG: VWA domain-containing protein [Acidobacteria bacterium]|nr:VWA domain-containing protein [Acidobacteriota bacterium]
MGIPKSALAAAAVIAAWSVIPRAAQQTPTFRTGARVVPLFVTVTDETKRLVPNLTKADFEILDNEKPQAISLFDNEILPITVVVMLDTSGSMTLNIDFVREGAEQFLLKMLPDDKASVGAFNDKIQFVSVFSPNREEQIAALKDLDFGNPTRLYDAIDASLTRLLGIEGRRVVLVFTDGDDTASKTSQGPVLERARNEEVMIYAIGLQSNYFNGQMHVRTRPDRGLRKLAEDTGGGYFELERTDELGPTFTRVSEELHSQYLMGFAPTVLDGKVHKLDVRMKQPNMRARARKNYLAVSEQPGPVRKK